MPKRLKLVIAAVAVAAVAVVCMALAVAGTGDEGQRSLRFTDPASMGAERTNAPTLRGDGASGAAVTVFDSTGQVLCAARVEGGSWSCQSSRPMGDGRTMVVAEQNLRGKTSRAEVAFVVDTSPDDSAFPLTQLLAAGVVVALGLAAVATCAVYLRRQRRHEPDSV